MKKVLLNISQNSQENTCARVSFLTHFQPMFHFYTPRKHQKTSGFLMFSRAIEVEHWLKMG